MSPNPVPQRVAQSRRGEPFTVENFHSENPTHELVQRLYSGGAFGRGLPTAETLSAMPDVVASFRDLLRTGVIKIASKELNVNEAVRKCHRQGWLHAYQTANEPGFTCYTFPSPLHTVCLSWRLVPTDNIPNFPTLFDMALKVISNFKPSQLQIPIRRAGIPTPVDKPPEAQYQDEFYRSLFSVTFGNVRVSPEFASARRARVAGRIDFFIPVVKWGVEITRDGARLTEHSSRFAHSGAYGAWLSSGDMVDYILLDCRTRIPRDPHPGIDISFLANPYANFFLDIKNLFHVVFQDDYRKVVVYDNMVKQVKGPIALLEN